MKINRFFAWTAAAVLAFALTAVPMTDKPCCGASAVITAEAAEAEKLAFTVQPKIFRGKLGDTVVFSVEASGAKSYQWQQDTGKGWKNIDTNAGRSRSITTSVSAERLKYKYRCVISDGKKKIASKTVYMMLDEKLTFTKQPVSYKGDVGDVVRFSVDATGAVSYQWQQNTGKGWKNIATNAGRSKSVSVKLTEARLGYKYRCVISDGRKKIASRAVGMSLKDVFAIIKKPADHTGELGDKVKFTVEANSAASYQWQQNTGDGWKNIDTGAGRSKSITMTLTAERLKYKYRCIVSNGTRKITSGEVCMKLNRLAITEQPTDCIANVGDIVSFTVKAAGAASYQWQVSKVTGWEDVDTEDGRTASIKVEVTEESDLFMYRCIVSNGTERIVSNEVYLKI